MTSLWKQFDIDGKLRLNQVDSLSHSDHNNNKVCFGPFVIFFTLHTSAVAPGGFRGVCNPPHIFKLSKFLKRSIINTFPCVVVFALNLVLRYLNVLNFLSPSARPYIYSKFPKYWTWTTLTGKITIRPCTYKILLAFSAIINFSVNLN